MAITQTLSRAGARFLGFPPGMGGLLSPATRKRLVLSVVGSFLISLLDMLGVLAMVPMMQFVSGQAPDSGALGVIDRLLGSPGSATLIGAVAGLVVGAFVAKDLVSIVFRRWQLGFMARQEAVTSTRLLDGYLRGPYSLHLARNTSDKVWTIEYAVQIGYTGGISAALGAVTEILTITLILVSLLLVSPTATFAAIVYFGLAGFLLQRYVRRHVEAAGKVSLASSQTTNRTSLQALGAAKEVKLRSAHGKFTDTYRTARMEGATARATQGLMSELPKYLLEIVFVLGIGLMAFVLTSTGSQATSLITLGVFVAAGSRILPSAVRLLSAVSGIRFSRAPLGHLVREEAMLAEAVREEEALVVTTEVPRGRLEIQDLHFAYSDRPDEDVLRGVDLTIEAGTSVAVVGGSGAGKSTVMDLVLGLHRPTSGSIRAGGVSIFDNLPAWKSRLAVVPQDVYLLDESLQANIAFDEEIDPERLQEALVRAQLTELVADLPDGVRTEVGERGSRLSGGQRQRIGIARAIYRRPELLVLDEATSALDNETEQRLTETIEGLRGSMTMLIVAHRLSTVRHCDALAFMKQGRVESFGTFEEVRASNPDFARLVALGTLDRA